MSQKELHVRDASRICPTSGSHVCINYSLQNKPCPLFTMVSLLFDGFSARVFPLFCARSLLPFLFLPWAELGTDRGLWIGIAPVGEGRRNRRRFIPVHCAFVSWALLVRISVKVITLGMPALFIQTVAAVSPRSRSLSVRILVLFFNLPTLPGEK